MKGALSIPIIATLSLLAAYFAIIQEWTVIYSLLYGYVIFISAVVIKKYIYHYMRSNPNFGKFDFPIPLFRSTRIMSLNLTFLEFMILLFSLYFVYIYIQTKYWIANNVIAICFAIYAIESWLVGNIKHIFLIFMGLIAYDVYFVFASDVMMTVAKGIDLPLKILLPVDT